MSKKKPNNKQLSGNKRTFKSFKNNSIKSNNLLTTYYSKIFPVNHIFKWLSYNNRMYINIYI